MSLRVVSYVLMPEHAHLLIYPLKHDYSISAILASIQRSVSGRAVAHVRKHAPAFMERMLDSQPSGKRAYRFWQRGGGYDRNLWKPSYIWQTIDYIHENPVRRRLCAAPRDGKWSSAATCQDEDAGDPTVDRESLPDGTRRR